MGADEPSLWGAAWNPSLTGRDMPRTRPQGGTDIVASGAVRADGGAESIPLRTDSSEKHIIPFMLFLSLSASHPGVAGVSPSFLAVTLGALELWARGPCFWTRSDLCSPLYNLGAPRGRAGT